MNKILTWIFVVLFAGMLAATLSIDSIVVQPVVSNANAYCTLTGHETTADLSLANFTAAYCWLKNGATVSGTCNSTVVLNGTAKNMTNVLTAGNLTADSNIGCNATLTVYGLKTISSTYNDTAVTKSSGTRTATLSLVPYATGNFSVKTTSTAVGETVSVYLNGVFVANITPSGTLTSNYTNKTFIQGVNNFTFTTNNLSVIAQTDYNGSAITKAGGTNTISPSKTPIGLKANVSVTLTGPVGEIISAYLNGVLLGISTQTGSAKTDSWNNRSISTGVNNITVVNSNNTRVAQTDYNDTAIAKGTGTNTITTSKVPYGLVGNLTINTSGIAGEQVVIYINGVLLGTITQSGVARADTWNNVSVVSGVNNISASNTNNSSVLANDYNGTALATATGDRLVTLAHTARASAVANVSVTFQANGIENITVSLNGTALGSVVPSVGTSTQTWTETGAQMQTINNISFANNGTKSNITNVSVTYYYADGFSNVTNISLAYLYLDGLSNLTNSSLIYTYLDSATNVVNVTVDSNAFAAAATTSLSTSANVTPSIGKCDNLVLRNNYTVGASFTGNVSSGCINITANNTVVNGSGYTFTTYGKGVSITSNNVSVINWNIVSSNGAIAVIGANSTKLTSVNVTSTSNNSVTLNNSNYSTITSLRVTCDANCLYLGENSTHNTVTSSYFNATPSASNSSTDYDIYVQNGSSNNTFSALTYKSFYNGGADNTFPDNWYLPVAIGTLIAVVVVGGAAVLSQPQAKKGRS